MKENIELKKNLQSIQKSLKQLNQEEINNSSFGFDFSEKDSIEIELNQEQSHLSLKTMDSENFNASFQKSGSNMEVFLV